MRNKMTRRERILTALNNGVPDRPPISFDIKTDVELLNVQKAYEYFGATDKKGLYTTAGIDGFSVWEWNAVMGNYVGEPKVSDDGVECDFWGNYYPGHFGLSKCDTIDQLNSHRWPVIEDFDFSEVYQQAKEIQAQDMVVAAGHVSMGYQMHNMLRGNENALYDVNDEKYTACYVEHLTAFTLDYMNELLKEPRGLVDVVRGDRRKYACRDPGCVGYVAD